MIPSGNGVSRLEQIWRQDAHQNLTAWGLQKPQPLILTMAEEVSEMADALELDDVEGGRGVELLVELRDLGNEIRDYLEQNAEDEEGNPLAPADRTPIHAPIDEPGELIAELDDLMPLGYQLQARILADYGELRRFQQPAQQAPRDVEERQGSSENPWDELDDDELMDAREELVSRLEAGHGQHESVKNVLSSHDLDEQEQEEIRQMAERNFPDAGEGGDAQ